MRAAVDVPLLANMTEFGKSELFTRAAARRRRHEHRHLPGLAAAARDGRGDARARRRSAPRARSGRACSTRCRPAPSSTSCSTTRATTTSTTASSTSPSHADAEARTSHDRQSTDEPDAHDPRSTRVSPACVVDTPRSRRSTPRRTRCSTAGYPVQELAASCTLRGGRLPALARRAARRAELAGSRSASGRSAGSTTVVQAR